MVRALSTRLLYPDLRVLHTLLLARRGRPMWGTRRDQGEAAHASARRSGGFSRRWSTPSAAQGSGQPRPMSRVGRPRRPWFAHRRRHEAKLHAAAHVVGCLLVPLRTLVEAVWQPHSAHTCRFQGREASPRPTPNPSPGPDPELDPDPEPNPNLEGAPRRVARYLLRPVAGVSYARR